VVHLSLKIKTLCAHITLSNKPELTFSKEHQTGACWFDVLSIPKGPLCLSFTWAIFDLIEWLFLMLRINYVNFYDKTSASDGEVYILG
jgi:hypothetical protein